MPQIYHAGNYLGDATPGHKIYNEYGTAMTDRSRLEFTGEGVEVTDDAVNGKTVVFISAGGGGGIPLANPTNISITNQDEAAAICWTDPPNVIVDMETIATWVGTLVVRKAGAAPQSKTDGVIVVDSRVRDQYASTGFVDTGLTNGVTYYYGIFPYTTQNVYNYNSVAQFSPAAIYPTAVSDFAASGGNAQATVTWTTPQDASSVNIVVSATGEADRTFTAATSPLMVTGLINDVTYTVKAVSVNAKGRTTESAGVTVTPQSDITYQGWLAAGGVTGSYSSLADVLADEIAVRKLMTIHAAVDYLCTAHSDSAMISTIFNNDIAAKWITLRAYAEDKLVETFPTIAASADKYGYGEWALIDNVWQPKGNVPVMTANDAPYGEASGGGTQTPNPPYLAFDGDLTTNPNSSYGSDGNTQNSWIGYKFANPVCVKKIRLYEYDDPIKRYKLYTFKLQYSNDGTTWTDIADASFDMTDKAEGNFYYFSIPNNVYALCWKLQPLTSKNSNAIFIRDLQFYGRELNAYVPAMTSNTAPYGEAFSTTPLYYNNKEYSAYKGMARYFEDTGGVSGSGNFSCIEYKENEAMYIGYYFYRPVNLKFITGFIGPTSGNYPTYRYKLQYTIDKNNWIDIPNSERELNTISLSIVNCNLENIIGIRTLVTYKGGKSNFAVRSFYAFGIDYSEYDWDTDHPRHYIYDHGVELENITLAGTATKEEFDIKLSAANAQASATINTTAYTAMGGKVGRYGSGTNQLICGSASSNFSATNMPDGNGIDITNVNSSVAVGVKQTANGTFTAEEIWVA